MREGKSRMSRGETDQCDIGGLNRSHLSGQLIRPKHISFDSFFLQVCLDLGIHVVRIRSIDKTETPFFAIDRWFEKEESFIGLTFFKGEEDVSTSLLHKGTIEITDF